MTDYAIIYDAATGAQLGNFMGTDGAAAQQQLPPGATYMLVPVAAWSTPVNLAVVQASICTKIEAEADAIAAPIITLSPRKSMTATAIKAESEALALSSAEPTPFLQALAAASATTIAQEKAAFDAAWAAAVVPGALINATSIAAQRRVMAATTLAGIAAAANIDWAAVMATL